MRIVGGDWRGRGLATPKDNATRPTSDRTREALFSILAGNYPETLDATRVLDLFAGTGALGFEALSRGADFCLFVDNAVAARAMLRENTERLGAAGQCKVFRRDATRLGPRPVQTGAPYHLVFADPPYGRGLAEKALTAARQGDWLAADALIVVEEDRRSNFSAPERFDEIDRRAYGDTELIFLRG